jgi:RNA polymerase sigma-70 factor (family 1)
LVPARISDIELHTFLFFFAAAASQSVVSNVDQTEQAFKELFSREYNNLCQYAYSYLKEEHMAEDVVQDTFVKIWETKKELIGKPEIRFYLVTAVRNNAISVLRRQANSQTRYVDETPEPAPEVFHTRRETLEHEASRAERVAAALNTLPPKCREIFLMVKMQGMSYRQVAESLDISVKTVENQMGKALRLVRDCQKVVTTLIATLFFFSDMLIAALFA